MKRIISALTVLLASVSGAQTTNGYKLYRDKWLSDTSIQLYGLAVAKARIDRYYEQPAAARQLMHDDALIRAVWEDGLDESSLASPGYLPSRAYKCPPPTELRFNWEPYAESEKIEFDITKPDKYLRTESIGYFRSEIEKREILLFPTFMVVKEKPSGNKLLYLHNAGLARRMASNLITGGDGTLPNLAKANAITATYKLTTSWDNKLSDILLIEADLVFLGLLMEYWASEDSAESQVRALVAAYILNTSKITHWAKRLQELQTSIGQKKRYGVVGQTIDEKAKTLVTEVEIRRRAHVQGNPDIIGSYSDLPAFCFSDAAMGYARAAYAAGDILLNGKFGYPKDSIAAARYFKFAAARSMPGAAHNLATCYRDGVGVPKNLEKAFFWYRQAAILCFPQSQLNLALCYKDGTGTASDEVAAIAWIRVWKESGMPPPNDRDAQAIERLLRDASPATLAKATEMVSIIKIESVDTCRKRASDMPWDVVQEP